MNSPMFKLNYQDFVNGAVNAVVAAVVIGLAGIVTQSGFDLFSADWGSILHLIINSAFAAFVGSLGKNFLTDSNGKIMGSVQVK